MLKSPSAILTATLLMSVTPTLAADFVVRTADGGNGRLTLPHFASVMGCTGQNISPHLAWSGAPEGTKSFVVTIYDQDAQTGSGWWHWVVTNIPASVWELPQGAGTDQAKLPNGALQTNTDAGRAGYGGPCPPVGQTHRYLISVNALKVEKLELPPNATAALVGMMTNMNSLGKATLTLTAGR
jgi:Raf kinase inhibitor-like YbhB/YbcL family protein